MTSEYRYLARRVKCLKKHFNFKQGVNGPNSTQEDKLRGFLLLCHAEIEDYLESIAKRVFDESVAEWRSNKTANYQLACYFVRQEQINASDVLTQSFQMISNYSDVIKKNHGIKTDNILKMYAPLGYLQDDFDPVLLMELDNFGKLRGEAAHTSCRHTTTLLDKNNEFSKVDNLLRLLQGFESAIKLRYKDL